MGSGADGVAVTGRSRSIVSPSGKGIDSKGGEGGGSETLSILKQGAVLYDGGTPSGEEIVDGVGVGRGVDGEGSEGLRWSTAQDKSRKEGVAGLKTP